MSTKPRHLFKSTIIVSLSTLLSRIFGFVRDMLIFRYFDKTATDAFIVAFRLPNLLRTLLGEGALSVSFIPVFTQHLKHKSPEETKEFIGVCFTYLSLFLAILIMLG